MVRIISTRCNNLQIEVGIGEKKISRKIAGNFDALDALKEIRKELSSLTRDEFIERCLGLEREIYVNGVYRTALLGSIQNSGKIVRLRKINITITDRKSVV